MNPIKIYAIKKPHLHSDFIVIYAPYDSVPMHLRTGVERAKKRVVRFLTTEFREET